MNASDRLKILIDSGRTVFRPQDLRLLWNNSELNAKINAVRMVDRNLLFKPCKGYYALNENYNTNALANLIITPSYVSFNTAIACAGINFQQRNSVDSVALLSYRRTIQGTAYAYYSMKKDLFFQQEGVIIKNNLAIACPERAILDSLYFGFIPDIDNPDRINPKYLEALSRIYPMTIQKKARKFYGT